VTANDHKQYFMRLRHLGMTSHFWYYSIVLHLTLAQLYEILDLEGLPVIL